MLTSTKAFSPFVLITPFLSSRRTTRFPPSRTTVIVSQRAEIAAAVFFFPYFVREMSRYCRIIPSSR